jgi:hypothetical protein
MDEIEKILAQDEDEDEAEPEEEKIPEPEIIPQPLDIEMAV